MKVMVMERFKDKYTDEVRDLGSVFECSEERFAEIQSASSNLVRVVKDVPKVEEPVTEEVKEKEPAKKSTRKRTTKSASDKVAEEPKKGEE